MIFVAMLIGPAVAWWLLSGFKSRRRYWYEYLNKQHRTYRWR